MPNWQCGMVTPNVVNREWMVALNVEWNKACLWTPNEDVMALNAMQKQKHDSECRNEDVALNAKTKVGKGSERQAKRNIDECQSETKALHAQLNW